LKRHEASAHSKILKPYWCSVLHCERSDLEGGRGKPFPRKEKRDEHLHKIHNIKANDLSSIPNAVIPLHDGNAPPFAGYSASVEEELFDFDAWLSDFGAPSIDTSVGSFTSSGNGVEMPLPLLDRSSLASENSPYPSDLTDLQAPTWTPFFTSESLSSPGPFCSLDDLSASITGQSSNSGLRSDWNSFTDIQPSDLNLWNPSNTETVVTDMASTFGLTGNAPVGQFPTSVGQSFVKLGRVDRLGDFVLLLD
jgi:hypothetical protein